MSTNQIKCEKNQLKLKDVIKNKFVDIFFVERSKLMRKVYIQGYVSYEDENYTFTYEEKN